MAINKNYLTNKQPKLRFRGFSDEYDIHRVSDISKSYKGNGYKKEDIDNNGKYYVILYGELFTSYTNIIENVISKTNVVGKVLSKKNMLLIPGSSTSLSDFFPVCSIDRDDVYLGGDINVFNINENNNSRYLSYLFSKNIHLENIFRLTEGSTINHLYKNFIDDYEICIPKIEEQQKISNFLSLLDKQIDLYVRKLELIEQRKKYYLNNLFSIKGNPKLRFKGFNSELVNNSIKELFKITRGTVLPKDKLIKDGFPVYSSQTLNNGLLGYYHKYQFYDAITWTTDGANAGTINYRKGKFFCTNVCGVLLELNQKPSIYFSNLISKFAQKHVSFKLGNPKLMNNVMGNINIIYTIDLLEQEKISSLFEKLDEFISICNKRINILKQRKKYYLNKLFS